jgi:hypothetical protein
MKFKILVLTLLIGAFSFAQKKEKIKGNKFVKVKQHQIADFNELNLNENFEVFLLKGETPQIEIEADENLHEVIQFLVTENGVLSLKTSHQITSKKKLNIRITVTNSFNSIIIYDKAIVNSLIDLDIDKMNITAKDNSKIYLTLKTNDFKFTAEKHVKTELNLTTKKGEIQLSESTDLEALINAEELKIDLYQKANAKIEGEVTNLNLRVDNAANYKGQKLSINNATVIAEGSADCDIEVKDTLVLEASGSSKINIYNTPKIDLKKFEDSASVFKK